MTSNPKVIKAEKILSQACQKSGVSKEGARWIEFAIDPMHDRPVAAEGYPDQIMAPSTLQIIKQQLTVISTNGTNTWDCSIFSDSTTTVNDVYLTTTVGNNVYQSSGQGAVAYSRGGVQVRQGTTGTDLNTLTAPSLTSQKIAVPNQYYTGSDGRLVARGFEVHNTTNELAVSGAVTCWRLPKVGGDSNGVATLVVDNGVTACIPTAADFEVLPRIPVNVAEATNLFGSQTWMAKEGAYVVPVMVREENVPGGLDIKLQLATDGTGNYASLITSTGAAKIQTVSANTQVHPFSVGGAFFSGLSPSTTLVINTVDIIERFPQPTNVDLTTLARPSNAYDPKAIRMYSEITRSMAPGVPVCANGLGDWFMSAARIAMQAVPAVMGILNGSASPASILSSSRGDPGSNAMLSLYKPQSHNYNNNGMQMQQSTLGYAAGKIYDSAKEWITSPSKNEKQMVIKEEIRSTNNRSPGLQQATQLIRQPQIVFVKNHKNGGNMGNVNLSQISRNRGTNVWSKDEEYLRKQKKNTKR